MSIEYSQDTFESVLSGSFSNTAEDLKYLIREGYIQYGGRKFNLDDSNKPKPTDWHDYSVLKKFNWGRIEMKIGGGRCHQIRSKIHVE